MMTRNTKSIEKRVTITPLKFDMEGISVNDGLVSIENLHVNKWYVGHINNEYVGYLPTYIRKINIDGETVRVIAIDY